MDQCVGCEHPGARPSLLHAGDAGGLCLSVDHQLSSEAEGFGAGAFAVQVKPCAGLKDTFTLKNDSQLTIVQAFGGAAAAGWCLAESKVQPGQQPGVVGTLSVTECVQEAAINHDSTTDPVPLQVLSARMIAEQVNISKYLRISRNISE
eukprot:SAG31_NODE_6441_length_2017_cov_1.540146_2_plen_149_part_00